MGPLTLYFTLHEIEFCATWIIDGLCSSLAKLSLHNFNNDNMAEHASVWQKLLTFLQVYNEKFPWMPQLCCLTSMQSILWLASINISILWCQWNIHCWKMSARFWWRAKTWNDDWRRKDDRTQPRNKVVSSLDPTKTNVRTSRKQRTRTKTRTRNNQCTIKMATPLTVTLQRVVKHTSGTILSQAKKSIGVEAPNANVWGATVPSCMPNGSRSSGPNKKEKDGKDNKKIEDKQGTTLLLQIPQANYTSTIGDGFSSPF